MEYLGIVFDFLRFPRLDAPSSELSLVKQSALNLPQRKWSAGSSELRALRSCVAVSLGSWLWISFALKKTRELLLSLGMCRWIWGSSQDPHRSTSQVGGVRV